MTRLVPFEPAHVPGAAALVAAAAAEARRSSPLVVGGLEDSGRVAGLLGGPASGGLGVAAIRGRQVLGFLVPLTFELWGGPGAFVPEWGQAAPDPELVADLYAAASPRWEGRTVHAVTLWAHEPEVEAAWHGLGFGRVVVDAVRGLEVPARRARGVTVRPAGLRDAFVLARLERALWEHLSAPPACRVHPAPGGRAEAARRLADPAQPVWLAEVDGAPAGYISLQPSDSAPASLRSPDLVRCDGAFVVPECRGRGVVTTLLGTALRWAATAGFSGCSLDYESANLTAARVWPQAGFSAVLYSVGRRIT